MITLGGKPLDEMSEDELIQAITHLQSNREALRAEAVEKAKAKREAKERGEMIPREKKAPKVSLKNQILANLLADLDKED